MKNAKGRRVPPGTLTLARFERLQKLNPLFAQGGYTLEELSRRFGVSLATISEDRQYIMEKWWAEDEGFKTREKRVRRIKELEQIKRLALESYYRSRQDKEEVTTRYDKVPCEECGGTGKLPKCKCIACEGLGFVNEEVISRKVQGQPGDAAFLNVAKEVVKEMCRLEALYKQPDVKVQHVVSGELEYAHRFDGYEGVDPEKLLAAKRALDELEMTTVDGEVVQIAEEKEVESSDG